MAREEHGGEAEKAGRGLAAGRAQERAEADDLAVGETRRRAAAVLDLGVEEVANQAVVGMRTQVLDELEPVAQRVQPRLHGTGRDRIGARVAGQGDVDPLAYLSAVGLGHAEEREDDVHGEWGREGSDEVAAAISRQ